jgi:hypothetical protein
MSDISNNTYGRLVSIGLKDPFIRQIAGVAALAVIASFVILVLGTGVNAILTLSLLLSFGVVLVILRTLMNNMDTSFVRTACFIASTVIMGVFLIFGVLLIPAATICYPPNFAIMLGLNSCRVAAPAVNDKFEPVSFPMIHFNSANGGRRVKVIYRPERRSDAERIVGALRSAGYQSDGVNSNLLELTPPFSGATVLKWISSAQSTLPEVSELIRTAIPVKALTLSVSSNASSFGDDLQIDLF